MLQAARLTTMDSFPRPDYGGNDSESAGSASGGMFLALVPAGQV